MTAAEPPQGKEEEQQQNQRFAKRTKLSTTAAIVAASSVLPVNAFLPVTSIAPIHVTVDKNESMFAKFPGAPCADSGDYGESTHMLQALQNMLKAETQNKRYISEALTECLLKPADESKDSHNRDKSQIHDEKITQLYEYTRGVPQRPYHRELSHRLLIIHKYKHEKISLATESTDAMTPPFLPASRFGVTEFQCTSSTIPKPPLRLESVEGCTEWLQNAGEKGILAILGMRRTIGTVTKSFQGSSSDDKVSEKQYLFPPPISQLLASSCKLHKPNTKSCLTVAARALAKHAHRGADGFFGSVKGGEAQKNRHAEMVVQRLIREAAWINIHAFGGLDEHRPVIEVRTVEGYGARWSAVWKTNAFSPEDILFRGFLEPNMEHGHETRWRH